MKEAIFRFEARLIETESGRVKLVLDISNGTFGVHDKPMDVPRTASGGATDVDTATQIRRAMAANEVIDAAMSRLVAARSNPAAPAGAASIPPYNETE